MSPLPFALVDADRRSPLPADTLTRRTLPATLHGHRRGAPGFRPDAELAAAVNVAISVGQPLLVTGEPGTGKTQIAYWLAWYFGLLDPEAPEEVEAPPYLLPVKSTTTAADLLYQFDTVAYFHAGQDRTRQGTIDPREFLRRGPLWRAFDDAREGRAAVVLLDEIDKAPRDFPNDLLHELDQYAFDVRETGERISRERGQPPPLVVITSNSERRLPEPFLRRCIFHHIAFTPALVRRAVEARRADTPGLDDATREAAVTAFLAVREVQGLRKRPATGELLAWLVALQGLGARAPDLGPDRSLARLPALSALIKDSGDLEALAR